MFKIFLKILFIYTFFLTNLSANDNLLKKFHKLKIYSLDNNKLIKIGSVRGKVEEYPWGFNYYLNSKNGNLSELIETFYFDNYGDHMSRFNRWARDVVFISNSKNGCNNSEDKVFHGVIDNGATHFNCFSVKIFSKNDEVYGPNFNAVEHIPMIQRKAFLNKYLKKNSINLPENILRIESYFYKAGKLIWVFYTLDADLFYDDLSEKNIEHFIKRSLVIHQNFENDLKYKSYMKIE